MIQVGGDFELAIVCTDKGQHPSRDLGRVVFTPFAARLEEFRDSWPVDGGTIGLPFVRDARTVKDGQYMRPLPSAIKVRLVGTEDETRGGLEVTCPTCKRNLLLNKESVTAIVFAYREIGIVRFDISSP